MANSWDVPGLVTVQTGTPVNAVAATLSTSLTGSNNDLDFTARTKGAAGNALTVAYVAGGSGSPLGVRVAESSIIVDLGMDSGIQATADIGSGAHGTVTITASQYGTLGNTFTVEVVDGEDEDGALDATFDGTAVLVTLGMDSGDEATADIGSGADGTVTITVDAAGAAGNDYTVEVLVDTDPDLELDAALDGTTLTVTLGTDGAGDLDPSKNTATLVAAAIDALSGVSALASGDGSAPLTGAEGPTSFTGGGDNLAPDNAKNTATLVAAAIDALEGVDATASGTGSSPLTLAEGPTAFTGGAGGAILTTAAQVKQAIDGTPAAAALVSVANKSGNDGTGTVTAMAAAAFTGGIDGTPGELNQLYVDDDALYVCRAAQGVSGANWYSVALVVVS